jgi:hypothetical protein
MDNHEIALEQQGGNARASPRARGGTGVVLCLFHPVGTHVTVIFKDKASFGRVLYEGTKIAMSFMIATVLGTDRKRFRLRLDSTTTKSQRLNCVL